MDAPLFDLTAVLCMHVCMYRWRPVTTSVTIPAGVPRRAEAAAVRQLSGEVGLRRLVERV